MLRHTIFWEFKPDADLREEITIGAAYFEQLFDIPATIARVAPTGRPGFMLPAIEGMTITESDLLPAGKICIMGCE
jgi:hypothetical protein